MKTILTLLTFFALTFLFLPSQAFAQEEVFEVVVEREIERKETNVEGEKQLYQKLKARAVSGSLEGEEIILESGSIPIAGIQEYKKGDKLLVTYSETEGQGYFYITDYVRRDGLALLFIIFVFLAILVGRIWGATSILGMAFSFLIIFKFILPQIMNGEDPVFTTILASFLIIPVTFYLSHGFYKKTHIAIIGTVLSLIITGFIAVVFVNLTKLTGFATEEAGFLQFAFSGEINMKGLLLAGIIIGTLGILDDVTVSQSSIAFQLKQANPKIKPKELFFRAMSVGQDHISSMINTLVLVYTGASMPLLILFADSTRSFGEVVNYEMIADEIVRTLVGSIGLIMAVPITTFLACFSFGKKLK